MNEATAIAPEETKSTVSVRVIAIRHRTKQTKAGEARPTIVSFYYGKEVKEDKVIKTIELEAEQNEYDWLCGRHPVAWRDLEPDEDISAFAAHHVKYKKLKDGQLVPDGVHASQVKVEDKILSVATKVPSEFDGQQPGDVIVMSLGGSGDNLAFALASRGATLKPRSELRRITPHILKRVIDGYNEEERQNTTEILLKHYGESPSDFHGTEPRDMGVIVLRESFKYRRQVVEARIACAARLRQQQIGALYCSKDGYFPEGEIEKMFADGMANNVILNALTAEEVAANSKLAKACNALDVYTVVFKPIRGIGPSIAARIIGAIIHIGRFPDRAKFRAFCGVHILPDGRLPRKRAGEVANWVGEARQAFYLAGGLFNRNPTSEWGKRLIAAKTAYRVKHPVEVSVGFNFVQNYRKLDNFFRSNKVDTNTIGFDLSTAAGLYAWFENCRQNLGEQAKKHVEPLGIFEGHRHSG